MAKKIINAVLWLIGLVCILSAIFYATQSKLSITVPLGYLLLALMMIPYTWNMFLKAAKIDLHVAWRILLIVVVYLATGMVMSKELGINVDYSRGDTFADTISQIQRGLDEQ